MYKRFVYTSVIIIITILQSATSYDEAVSDAVGSFEEGYPGKWNESSGNSFLEEDWIGRSDTTPTFQSEVNRCIEDHQYLITESVSQGKQVILKCFKTNLMLNLLRYLGEPSKSSVKLFNGLLEFNKIPEKVSERSGKSFEAFQNKKNEYVRLYKKALQKLISERKRLNAYRNRTEEEKINQMDRINKNSQVFLSEVIKNFGNESVEEQEEEKLRKEVTDPRLLSVLDALSRRYMLSFRFYPGVSARMMRSDNGGVTFDLEFQDAEDGEEEVASDESSTREIKDGPQGKDIFDYDYEEDDDKKRKKTKDNKKKKQKEKKKKAKKLKKVLPYLLLPMIIQASLLPFVFKKLFFLAMKALLAGKMALILVGFNILRNTCIKNDDDFQKVRVEHYGYRRGEEYGAWINGRSLGAHSGLDPYMGQKPA